MDNLIVAGLATIAMLAFVIALYGVFVCLPLMLLWNYLMPDLFGLREISFGQAFGLYMLARCLFPVISK